ADIIITPLKPVLSEKSVQYLRNHIEIKTNDRHTILKTEEVPIQILSIIHDWLVRALSANKEEFKTAIMTPLKSDESKDLHHFRLIQVNSIKEMQKAFPNFDLIINKADGIGIKVSSNHAVMFIEVSDGPSDPDKKHIKDDAEKLLKEATFGLVSILRNYLDKSAEIAKNIKDGLENQTKELHKLRLSPNNCVPKVRDWLWVLDTKAT
ncbi:18607_t:CDS:2, partial [Racocetra fulgida]